VLEEQLRRDAADDRCPALPGCDESDDFIGSERFSSRSRNLLQGSFVNRITVSGAERSGRVIAQLLFIAYCATAAPGAAKFANVGGQSSRRVESCSWRITEMPGLRLTLAQVSRLFSVDWTSVSG